MFGFRMLGAKAKQITKERFAQLLICHWSYGVLNQRSGKKQTFLPYWFTERPGEVRILTIIMSYLAYQVIILNHIKVDCLVTLIAYRLKKEFFYQTCNNVSIICEAYILQNENIVFSCNLIVSDRAMFEGGFNSALRGKHHKSQIFSKKFIWHTKYLGKMWVGKYVAYWAAVWAAWPTNLVHANWISPDVNTPLTTITWE